jgi:hypothetical protein
MTEANSTAERATALDMIDDNAKPGSTVGADKNYDTAEFVAGYRERGCTPHVSQNDTNPPLGDRCAHHPPSRLSYQHHQAQADRRTVWVDEDCRRLVQDPASWPRLGRVVLRADRRRLQSHPHSQAAARGLGHRAY